MASASSSTSSPQYRSRFGDTTLTKVFVGGLAWETPTEELRRYFEQFGEILEAVIITDKFTGRSKGYGFVTFREPESARRSVADPNPVIGGRRANCNIAALGRPRPPSPRLGCYVQSPSGILLLPTAIWTNVTISCWTSTLPPLPSHGVLYAKSQGRVSFSSTRPTATIHAAASCTPHAGVLHSLLLATTPVSAPTPTTCKATPEHSSRLTSSSATLHSWSKHR
ncbi:uncharacterized protein LOC135649736 isoform X2 [Musa acuminata AAA Group]|uniref:uncharacterized protein LOC103997962 isoform X2 n=1 Tax=Musa acuminata AAA Group TaxID=214697 RepID=UPI0008A0C039|nr:PREDICTED: RNA-binding protein 38 isoform X2 [Musa acuminata subsp. malaccensis]